LPVLKGYIVDMPNIDTIRHNAFSPEPLPGTNKKINLGVYDVGRIKTIKVETEWVILFQIFHKNFPFMTKTGQNRQ